MIPTQTGPIQFDWDCGSESKRVTWEGGGGGSPSESGCAKSMMN